MTDGLAEKVRLFFALWPDSSIAKKMHGVARDNVGQYGGRAMRPETLHLTLAFLGDLPAESLPAARAAGNEVEAAPFRIALDRLGYWHHNHLLWAGCSAEDSGLTALAAILHEYLRESGFALEKRAFVPHMTLARNLNRPPPRESAIAAVEWQCDGFVLVRSMPSSTGAAYQMVGDWRLRN